MAPPRRLPATLLGLALCAACATAVRLAPFAPAPEAEGKDIREGLTRCLITPEAAAAANFTGIQAVCAAATPLDARCAACPCALADSVRGTLEGLGYKVDLSTMSQADATQALNLCAATLLNALSDANVDTSPIFDLVSCPPDAVAAAQSSCLRLGA